MKRLSYIGAVCLSVCLSPACCNVRIIRSCRMPAVAKVVDARTMQLSDEMIEQRSLRRSHACSLY